MIVKNKNLVLILLSLVTSYGLLMNAERTTLNSINVFMVLCIWICVFLLSKNTMNINNKRIKFFSIVLSIVFSSIFIIGDSINLYQHLGGITNSIFRSCYRFFSFIIISYSIIASLFQWLDSHENKMVNNIITLDKKRKTALIILCFFCFLVAWLPYFLQYYPGVLTPDSMYQISQIIGENELTNHHPVLHTAIISIFVNIGKVIGNYNIGIALYSLFQMIIMSSCFTYTINYMINKNVNISFIILSFLFFAFYPIHAIYSVTMWKDIPFALAVLMLTIQIDKMTSNEEAFLKSKKEILFLVLDMILVMLLRNNGVYVIYIMIPIMILSMKKQYKKFIFIGVSVLGIFALYKFSIFNLLNVKQVDISEALSIPVQQIARIEKEHFDELSSEEQLEIKRFIKSIDNLRSNYSPTISDPIKAELKSEEIKNNKIDFLKLCIHLALRFPKTTIVSFLCQNYGYWYPDFSYWKVREGISDYLRNIKQIRIKSYTYNGFKNCNKYL